MTDAVWLHDANDRPHFLYRRNPMRNLRWKFHGLRIECEVDTEGRRCGLAAADADVTCAMPADAHDGPHVGQTGELEVAVGPLVIVKITKTGERSGR